MTRRNIVGLGCLCILVLFGVLLAAYPLWHRHHCIEITREWARLAPLPASARNVQVKVTGNMFTRGFEVSFTAPLANIDAWLRASPGPASVRVVHSAAGVRTFEIKPGGGAMFAEVTVVDAIGLVKIRTYWS